MIDIREIYSIPDFIDILQKTLKEELGLGDTVIEALCEKIKKDFKYINWIRFQQANCPGCVSGPEECDVAYGINNARGIWERIVKGEIQACPIRLNGTIIFNQGKVKNIDISEHAFNVVIPLNEKEDRC